MGKAVIVAAVAEGLYKIRLVLGPDRIAAELETLDALDATRFARLNAALKTLADLRRAKIEAADGLAEVIQQWKDALIGKFNEEPPAIEPDDPNDPETGEPWEDADRAQDGPLFAAINAERTAASMAPLTRDSALDKSILRHLRSLSSSGRISHDDKYWTAADRARAAGFDFDAALGVGQCLAFGTRGAAPTVALWMRRSSDRALILSADFTQCGVAYVHAPRNPYGYLWGAVFAAPGPPLPVFVPPEPDPAQAAAEDAESVLEKIPLPTIEGFEPGKFGDVAAELARAAQRVRAAEIVVSELLGEALNIDARRRELQAVRDAMDAILDCWCCVFAEDVPINATVNLIEMPGYYHAEGMPRITTMNVRTADLPGRNTTPETVEYVERNIAIVPDVFSTGQLQHTTVMTPAETFHAVAMEPGAHRWRPLWRYGAIIAKPTADTANVALEPAVSRPLSGEISLALDGDDDLLLMGIPISYPPCNGEVFEIGDEVLILFEGFARDTPKIIGFRREPRPCPSGRLNWGQL